MQAHIRITGPTLTSFDRLGKGDYTMFSIGLGDADKGLRVTLEITDAHEAELLADALAEAAQGIRDADRASLPL